uniref:Uncharacterized protein n=1 Tax=Anguilla anguilla TaxID=7936 RepID=A0A0E9PVS0_ANGAN
MNSYIPTFLWHASSIEDPLSSHVMNRLVNM